MHDFQFFNRAALEALLELEYQHEVRRAQVYRTTSDGRRRREAAWEAAWEAGWEALRKRKDGRARERGLRVFTATLDG